jgi:hypothetical protein
MAHGHATDTTVHQANHGGMQAIEMVKRDKLVPHPVKASVFGRSARACSHERQNIVSRFTDLFQCFFNNFSP